jgi:hypothetical protein
VGFHNEARIPVIRGYQIAVLTCRTRTVCMIYSNMLGGASMMVRGINFPQEPIARDCLTKEYVTVLSSLSVSRFSHKHYLVPSRWIGGRPCESSS